jgi:fluoroquinolone transport system permease protein
MKRLLQSIKLDIQLQFRNGFYFVSAFVAAGTILLLSRFPEVDWTLFWPVIILENLVVNTFFFMAGLVLLEKSEGTLEALIVSPLRPAEYLAAKIGSLGLLSLLETILVVLVISGPSFNWLWMLLGILSLVALYILYSFFVVIRYDSIGEFILPAALWSFGFSLPLFTYFEIWTSPLAYLHPLQAPLTLMKAAYQTIPSLEMVYALLYSAIWIFIGFRYSVRAHQQFVVRKQGVRHA